MRGGGRMISDGGVYVEIGLPADTWPRVAYVTHVGQREVRTYAIERTCRNVYGGREFTCSECRTTWHVLRRGESGEWMAPGGFGHCPGCGARVVGE